METKELLKEIALKDPAYLTDSERAFIRDTSALMGVEFRPRKKCRDCYGDQAKLLWHMAKNQESDAAYQLKPGLDFKWRGMRINSDTLTDELAEQLISEGIPVVLFAKTPEK